MGQENIIQISMEQYTFPLQVPEVCQREGLVDEDKRGPGLYLRKAEK